MEAAAEKLHPLFLHLEGIEVVVDLFLGYALQVGDHLIIPLIDGFACQTILDQAVVDLGGLPDTLGNVVLQVGYLVVVAEVLEHALERVLINVLHLLLGRGNRPGFLIFRHLIE